jgi:thioredoxin 1
MVKVILVTTKTCPFCPIAKILWRKLQKDYDFDFEEVDADSERGRELVEKFEIRAVPATILQDENGERLAFVGVPSEEEAKKVIGYGGMDQGD